MGHTRRSERARSRRTRAAAETAETAEAMVAVETEADSAEAGVETGAAEGWEEMVAVEKVMGDVEVAG